MYCQNYNDIMHHIFGNGSGLEYVNAHNIFSVYNICLWLKNNKPDLKCLSERYENRYTKLEFYCNRCGFSFLSTWTNISNKQRYGCSSCAGKIVTDNNRL